MNRIFINRDANPDLNYYVESITASGDPFEILAALEEHAGIPLVFLLASLIVPTPRANYTSDEELIASLEAARHDPLCYLDPSDVDQLFVEASTQLLNY